MRGSATPDDKVAKFRAEFLITGNASESARRSDLPIGTGNDIAKRLRADPDFQKAREDLRRDYLDELVHMRMRMARKALERFEEDSEQLAPSRDGSVTIVDKRYEYGKLVVDAEKSAQRLAQIEAGNSSDSSVPITFNVVVKGDDETPPEAA